MFVIAFILFNFTYADGFMKTTEITLCHDRQATLDPTTLRLSLFYADCPSDADTCVCHVSTTEEALQTLR